MKHRSEFYRIFPEDILLAGSILLLAGALIFNQLRQGQGRWVLIYQNNQLLWQADIKLPQTIQAGKMILEIKDQQVRVRQSDCPRQICTHQGWISKAGQTLICIPNQILVEIAVSRKIIEPYPLHTP